MPVLTDTRRRVVGFWAQLQVVTVLGWAVSTSLSPSSRSGGASAQCWGCHHVGLLPFVSPGHDCTPEPWLLPLRSWVSQMPRVS